MVILINSFLKTLLEGLYCTIRCQEELRIFTTPKNIFQRISIFKEVCARIKKSKSIQKILFHFIFDSQCSLHPMQGFGCPCQASHIVLTFSFVQVKLKHFDYQSLEFVKISCFFIQDVQTNCTKIYIKVLINVLYQIFLQRSHKNEPVLRRPFLLQKSVFLYFYDLVDRFIYPKGIPHLQHKFSEIFYEKNMIKCSPTFLSSYCL